MFNAQKLPAIVSIFEHFRMAPTPLDEFGTVGRFNLVKKMEPFVHSNQPIEFVMLGFPFKSTNERDKVLGKLPDLAELATIQNFDSFNIRIKSVYEPGVKISIVSDGYVFNDILGVQDKTVEEYKEVSMDMAKDSPLKWFDVNDFYSGGGLDTKRDKIISQFGITPEKLEQDILMNPDVNYLYRGMIRFMEEEIATRNFPSRNQLQKEAKKIARAMMFRNEAYSNLVKEEFKNHIRLSMHPSVNNGAKYSFQLIPGNAKHSAWHSALVETNDGWVTMHRKDADAAGYKLVYKDNRPFYYKEAA